ncbi:MAG: YbaK/EbsC family protein [Anaerolineae bacterium]|nr:YbaK/EbsC family protein [Anaerolineae bacterium]
MSAEAFNPEYVQSVLDSFGLGIMIRTFENSTATSQMAADEIGCELGQIAKSICFVVEGQPILIIASGDQRVDDRKVAGLMGVGRKQVKFASAEQCLGYLGYAPGGVPPVGHRTTPRAVFLDDSLKRYEKIYPAGGSSNTIFEVTLGQMEQISGGTFADVRRESS